MGLEEERIHSKTNRELRSLARAAGIRMEKVLAEFESASDTPVFDPNNTDYPLHRAIGLLGLRDKFYIELLSRNTRKVKDE